LLASRTLCSYIPVSDHWLEIARDWCDALVCVIRSINGGNIDDMTATLFCHRDRYRKFFLLCVHHKQGSVALVSLPKFASLHESALRARPPASTQRLSAGFIA